MRRLSGVKAAHKEFEGFPPSVQEQMKYALQMACAGEKADIAKPMKGFDAGIFEVALPYRGDAFRAVYAVKIGIDLWVVHAFQKKSVQGIKTARPDLDVIRERVKRLKEQLR